MKTIIIIGLFVMFLVSVQFASGQTVDEIIDKYIAARGGKDKLKSIKSIYMEGSHDMTGKEMTVKIIKAQDKLSHTVFETGDGNGFMLVTDKEALNYFPMSMEEAKKVPDEVLPALQTGLDIAGPLVDYVAKGHKAELMGKDMIDGEPCYKIKLTTKAGAEIIYWIDKMTCLVIQSSTRGNTGVITIYRDYKAVDGIMFAHSIEVKKLHGGNDTELTTFNKIELNKPVEEKLYRS